jgi:putative sterol carrier protein
MDLMTPSSPTTTPETAAPAKPESALTVAAVFEKMPGAFVKDAAAGVDVIFQYCIAGPGGGDWSVAIKDQTCTVTRGRADKATCTLNIGDTDFIRLISGELPAMQAYTSGKLKIEGDIMKSQLIERLFKLA